MLVGRVDGAALFKIVPCFVSITSYVRNYSVSINPVSNLNGELGRKSGYSVSFLNSRITKNGRLGKVREAESIFIRMPLKNVVSWTAMITLYAENRDIYSARKVFDEMPVRNIASWNAIITAYVSNGVMLDEANHLFSVMPLRNSISYTTIITGYVKAGKVDRAEEIYCGVPVNLRDTACANALIAGHLKVGAIESAVRVFEGIIDRDEVSWSSVIHGYCKKKMISEAVQLFERMPKKNVITWTGMISGYMKADLFEQGFEHFECLRRDVFVKANSTTMTVMLEACGGFHRRVEGFQIHDLVIHLGFEPDVFLGNSIIRMYCGFGQMEEAGRAFHNMSRKDIVSWNLLIDGYVKASELEKAYSCFRNMNEKDEVSWTTMITGFTEEGDTEKALELFNEMPKKDDVSWTVVISGMVGNEEFEQAIHWFVRMVRRGIKPSPFTLSSVLSASSSLAALNQGLQFHACSIKTVVEFDISIQNSLISLYSKCGNVLEALQIFRNIEEPNNVSYNSMITGFSQNGFAKDALKLFEEMKNNGFHPNHVTFLGVLSACSHIGLVEEGQEYFKSIKSSYFIEPTLDHHACMVDILGRAGLIDEAVGFVNSMSLEPHSGIWGALLGASRVHSRLDVATLAANRLLLTDPENSAPYVVLSTLYSTTGREGDEEKLRRLKKMNCVRKSPGCSWIMLKDKVYSFFSGDPSSYNMGLHGIRDMVRLISNEVRLVK